MISNNNTKIFLIGFMGAGKTHWGKIWTKDRGYSFYDLDTEIERVAGKTISAIFDEEGETYFRKLESEVLESMFGKDKFILSCGGGTPCYHSNLDSINSNGLSVYLKTPVEFLFKRLLPEKNHRPLIRNLNEDQLKEYINDKLKEREKYYLQCDIILQEEKVTGNTIEKLIHG